MKNPSRALLLGHTPERPGLDLFRGDLAPGSRLVRWWTRQLQRGHFDEIATFPRPGTGLLASEWVLARSGYLVVFLEEGSRPPADPGWAALYQRARRRSAEVRYHGPTKTQPDLLTAALDWLTGGHGYGELWVAWDGQPGGLTARAVRRADQYGCPVRIFPTGGE